MIELVRTGCIDPGENAGTTGSPTYDARPEALRPMGGARSTVLPW